jgi:hypothetical protein
MTKLPYVRTMFATCMLFQVIYVACVLLWFIDPNLKGHYLLPAIFPNFTLLTIGSFIYGLIASGLYGWIIAITFAFFLQSVAGFSGCFVRAESSGQSKLIGERSWIWISEAQLYLCA